MALGGGTFVTQNKVLPGAYINFVSAANASANLSERGFAAVPFVGDWGADNIIIEVSTGDFQKNSLELFGYDYTHDKMKPFRELFRNARYAFIYKLNSGGEKASNKYATAVCCGSRGNDLKVEVQINADEPAMFDVSLYLETFDDGANTELHTLLDRQTVNSASDLKSNGFVTWNAGVVLEVTAGLPLGGGISAEATNACEQKFLELLESFSFNALCCPSNDNIIKGLYTAFTKRMRDERGVKFQCVTYNYNADYEGVVNVKNGVSDNGNEYSAVYWVTGVIAGTAVNKSALNKVYDGEYQLNVSLTQTQLEAAIKNGEFTFHRVGDSIRVLSDINSLVNVTLEKSGLFKENQTVRVIDQIANDIAVIFNTRYLGIVPNDAAGRVSLWSDIVKHHEQLQAIRAIEDFRSENVTVTQGGTKRSVVVSSFITVVNAMAQLYMVCTVA